MTKDNKPEDIWERLDRIPRHVFYTLLLGLMIVSLLVPLGLPIKVGAATRKFYDIVDAVPNDGVVVFDISFSPGADPELGPQFTAILHHVFSKPVRVLFTVFVQDGQMMLQIYLDRLKPETYGKVYGKDWVNFGYRAGGISAMAELAKDMTFFKTDYKGTPLSELAVMKGVKDYRDVSLIITVTTASGGLSSPEDWVQQWATPYKTPLLVAMLKMMIPNTLPYFEAGQVKAYMGGTDQAAEYELLVERPGKGLAYTDALTNVHLLVIAFVILGNVGYLVRQRRKKP
jgi:hypothetical protein